MDVMSDGDVDVGADVDVGVGVEGLCCRVPAVAERLVQLRHALAEWTARLGVAAEIVEDLVLASYEAMANVIEHAYRDSRGGVLELCARADLVRRTVTVTVIDYGRWRPPADHGSRGRGLPLIRHLADRAEIIPGRRGTTVTMTYRMA